MYDDDLDFGPADSDDGPDRDEYEPEPGGSRFERDDQGERAIPCRCGRGTAAELTSGDTVTVIDCDACQDDREG